MDPATTGRRRVLVTGALGDIARQVVPTSPAESAGGIVNNAELGAGAQRGTGREIPVGARRSPVPQVARLVAPLDG